MIGPEFILQQDYSPKHAANVNKNDNFYWHFIVVSRTRTCGSDSMAPTEPWSQPHGVCLGLRGETEEFGEAIVHRKLG